MIEFERLDLFTQPQYPSMQPYPFKEENVESKTNLFEESLSLDSEQEPSIELVSQTEAEEFEIEIMGQSVDIRQIQHPILKKILESRFYSGGNSSQWDDHDRQHGRRYSEYQRKYTERYSEHSRRPHERHSRAWYEDDCSP